MACALGVIGFSKWWGSRDYDGFREYHIVHKLFVFDSVGSQEGPFRALSYPGIPLPGSIWSFAGDVDPKAVCQYIAEMRPMVEGEATKYWEVEQVFSTKPNPKCIFREGLGTGTGNPADDPLNEPPIISGSFIKYTEAKDIDKDGKQITNSSFERIRGPDTEFDSSRVTVRIQKNEAVLDLPSKIALIDTVNSVTTWGFPARTVKLSGITWEQLYTANCICYYKVSYEFETNPEGFDRNVLDEGTKALKGEWDKTTGIWVLKDINGAAPVVTNPTHFIRITDFFENPMRVVLNGAGIPAVTMSGGTTGQKAGKIVIKYYPESDFVGEIANLPSVLECVIR